MVNRFVSAAESDTWALLSDVHIDADRSFVSRESCMAENLEQVVREILAEKDSLAGVIINGDCARNTGRPEDYETLAKIVQPILDAGLPLHLLLGNHDLPENITSAFGKLANSSPVKDRRCALIETSTSRLILMDSFLPPVNKTPGELGAAQLDWLEKELAKPDEKSAVIIFHHYPQIFPPLQPGEKPPRARGLMDTEAFQAIMDRSPAAKAWIWGHSHYWTVEPGTDGNYHRVNLPAVGYIFKPEAPLGWVRTTFSADHMTMKLICLDSKHPRHNEVHQLAWRQG